MLQCSYAPVMNLQFLIANEYMTQEVLLHLEKLPTRERVPLIANFSDLLK